MIVERHVCADQSVIVIQKIGRRYTVYTVPPVGFEPPEYHAREVNKAAAYKSYAEQLEAEVCDSF